MANTIKNAARDLFLSGEPLESIAARLHLECEMLEVWRDEDCWGPARELVAASSRLSAGAKDAEKIDALHEWIVDAFGRVLAWLAKMQGECKLDDQSDWSSWSKLTRCAVRALEMKQAITADIRAARGRRNPRHVRGVPCLTARSKRNGPAGTPALEDKQPFHLDDNAIVARALAFGIAEFAKVLSGEKPRKLADLARLASLLCEALKNLRKLRRVMEAVQLDRRIDEVAKKQRDHAA